MQAQPVIILNRYSKVALLSATENAGVVVSLQPCILAGLSVGPMAVGVSFILPRMCVSTDFSKFDCCIIAPRVYSGILCKVCIVSVPQYGTVAVTRWFNDVNAKGLSPPPPPPPLDIDPRHVTKSSNMPT
jgi:hypothetical protein